MSEAYEKAKQNFFEELGISAQSLSIIISSQIERSYEKIKKKLQHEHVVTEQTGRIADALAATLEEMRLALHKERESTGPMEVNLFEWKAKTEDLLRDVCHGYAFKHEIAKEESGGDRKWKHFWEVKLKVDVAICEIEKTLDWLEDRAKKKHDHRLYLGAGLLYYLGFEQYYLRASIEPFPEHIEKEDAILRRYRDRRDKALQYLTQPTVEDLLAQPFDEGRHQRVLIRAQDEAEKRLRD